MYPHMNSRIFRFLPLAAPLLLAACVSIPTGPSGMALPGTGKNFDQFRLDDMDCRQFAYVQAGGKSTEQAMTDSGVKSAAVGTAVGAAAGAAFDGGRGAAVGAGAGLLVGALAGSGAAESSAYGAQRRYDAAYMQCMYAKGHKIPVSGRFTSTNPAPVAPVAAPAPPAPSTYIPPPPPPVR